MSTDYRKDITALRAFAVVAVILNHWLPGFHNGIFGVDIFFVISGFVITLSLLKRYSKTNTPFFFKHYIYSFYRRRLLRILPPLFFYVAFFSLFVSYLIPNFTDYIPTAISSLFGLSNLQLIATSTDYFSESVQFNPFLQTWSLGIEEQFYLFYPFILAFLFSSLLTPRRFILVLSILATISLVLFLLLYPTSLITAYFSPATRFWELLAGCISCLASRRYLDQYKTLFGVTAYFNLATLLIITLGPFDPNSTLYLIIVLSASSLLFCAPYSLSLQNHLSNPILQHIGTISYSLYLYHWGVYVLFLYTLGPGHFSYIPLSFLTYLFSLLSFRYIERFDYTLIRLPKSPPLFFLLTQVPAILLSTLLYFFPFLLPGYSTRASNPLKRTYQLFSCITTPLRTYTCRYTPVQHTSNALKTKILVIGDSQAEMLLYGLTQLYPKASIQAVFSHGVAYPSLPETRTNSPSTDFLSKRQELYRNTLEALDQLQPGDTLIFSSRHFLRWSTSPVLGKRSSKITFYNLTQPITKSEAFGLWKNEFQALLARLSSRKIRLVLVGTFPSFSSDLPPSITYPTPFNSLYAHSLQTKLTLDRDQIDVLNADIDSFFAHLSSTIPGLSYINPLDILCSKRLCPPRLGQYRDSTHLSEQGSVSFWRHTPPLFIP